MLPIYIHLNLVKEGEFEKLWYQKYEFNKSNPHQLKPQNFIYEMRSGIVSNKQIIGLEDGYGSRSYSAKLISAKGEVFYVNFFYLYKHFV